MDDITLDTPTDDSTIMSEAFLKKNVQAALNLLLYPPTCFLYRAADQTTNTSPTWTAVSWDTLITDTMSATSTPMFSAGSPTRITIPVAGYYECSINAGISGAANNALMVAWRVNADANKIYGGDASSSTGTMNMIPCFTTLIPLAANDYLEALVKHTFTSSPPNITAKWQTPKCMVKRVRGI
jgi:hypothetical protein